MDKIFIKLKTARSLGFINILKVLVFRIQCKTRYFEKRLPLKQLTMNHLFYLPDHMHCPDISDQTYRQIKQKTNQIINGNLIFFSHSYQKMGAPPDWFLNPFTQKRHNRSTAYWSSAKDDTFGDIKILWEMSRMEWALTLSKMFVLTKNKKYLFILNSWLKDWLENNMPQTGPNWICAQETAIRLIHIILCSHILNQDQPLPALIDFVDAHCKRIEITRHYANAQNNNHAISEAAGLFIGGMWLNAYTDSHIKARKWQHKGRLDLEQLIQKLIAEDGSFAQHSLNYHRVLIATLNMVEYFRRFYHQPAFSTLFYKKASDATQWLFQMTHPENGRGPNLGANDGARLYSLSETAYTDYRPEIQLSSILLSGKRLYQNGHWDEPVQWLNIDLYQHSIEKKKRQSKVYKEGGYVVVSTGQKQDIPTWALIRCPNKRFRPHHADTLHFDLWINAQNILKDSGSYSYAESEPLRQYCMSSSAHNTVSFDSHDQMPVISRFLFGQWIQTRIVQDFSVSASGVISWCGAYQDYQGCYHQRKIIFDGSTWRIIDYLKQFHEKAILRWHLMNDHWQLNNKCLTGTSVTIQISSDTDTIVTLTEGEESLYYMKKNTIPVLEICANDSPAKILTEIFIS